MLKYLIIISLASSLAFPVLATLSKIYVSRDDEGLLVFSDSSPTGADYVRLMTESPVLPSMHIETSLLSNKPKGLNNDFQVVITQPKSNATIRNNTGSVHINGAVKPIFKQGFNIQLYLDGKAQKSPQSHGVFLLKNVDRGEHQIKMSLIDKKGKVIATSPLTTFYMHRAIVK
tara:strand:- start:145 stop:663 length:519 start_codon:yes stop_codon:yes gene_type:complete